MNAWISQPHSILNQPNEWPHLSTNQPSTNKSETKKGNSVKVHAQVILKTLWLCLKASVGEKKVHWYAAYFHFAHRNNTNNHLVVSSTKTQSFTQSRVRFRTRNHFPACTEYKHIQCPLAVIQAPACWLQGVQTCHITLIDDLRKSRGLHSVNTGPCLQV